MKNIWKIGFALLAVLMLAGCGNNKSYTEISYDDVLQKMEDKETFVLYIGSSECSACVQFKPVLERVIREYDLDVLYIDMAKLSDEQYNKFITVINLGNATPRVYFIEEGDYSQYSAIRGAVDYDTVVAKFKQSGYIEEQVEKWKIKTLKF